MEKVYNKVGDKTILVISVSIVLLAIIGALSYYNVNQNNNMARNLDNIAGKGIDPVAVRCAYANSSDTICIAYAASGKK